MMGSHLLVVGIRPIVAVAIVAQLGSDVVAELVVVRVHGASFTLGRGFDSSALPPQFEASRCVLDLSAPNPAQWRCVTDVERRPLSHLRACGGVCLPRGGAAVICVDWRKCPTNSTS